DVVVQVLDGHEDVVRQHRLVERKVEAVRSTAARERQPVEDVVRQRVGNHTIARVADVEDTVRADVNRIGGGIGQQAGVVDVIRRADADRNGKRVGADGSEQHQASSGKRILEVHA